MSMEKLPEEFKNRPFSSQIVYDELKKEYFVQKTYTEDKKHPIILPLTEWGLVKEVRTFLLVYRDVTSPSFEQPTQRLWYLLPISYNIEGKESEFWYLRAEIATTEPKPTINGLNQSFLSVMLVNVQTGQAMQAPWKNDLYHDEYSFLTIKAGKAKRIKPDAEGENSKDVPQKLAELLRSGTIMAITDFSLSYRLTS